MLYAQATIGSTIVSLALLLLSIGNLLKDILVGM